MVLPKSMRIKGHKCFDYIHKTGTRYNTSSMLLKVAIENPRLIKAKLPLKKDSSSFRCAVSISNKVSKSAVVRNYFRRIFHNHLRLRLLEKVNYKKKWLLISLRPNSLDKGASNLLKEIDNLLFKAGISND